MKIVVVTALLTCLGASSGALAAPTAPADGPYTFTGTATIISGPSTCINDSPAGVAGDIISSDQGRSYYFHVRAASATLGFGAQLKASDGGSVARFGGQVDGHLTYVLLPSPNAHKGAFAAATTSASRGTFTQALTIVTAPLTGTGSGTCQIGFQLTATPGISKPLLKLFKGVL